MNVCKASSRDTLARLFWALRPNLATDAHIDPVSPHFAMETKYVEAAKQAGLGVSAPHDNSREATDRSRSIASRQFCRRLAAVTVMIASDSRLARAVQISIAHRDGDSVVFLKGSLFVSTAHSTL